MTWALLTGGTDGIGRAVAGQLAAGGHAVLIVGANNAKGRRAERETRRDSANAIGAAVADFVRRIRRNPRG